MSVATAPSPPLPPAQEGEFLDRGMTIEEFLALPEDGIRRVLIRGRVREVGMTVRNRFHCKLESNFVYYLKDWLFKQPEPRGEILSGEAGFRLDGTKESLVGIDIAYVSAEHAARVDPKQKLYDGAPVLAVEILSPSDKQEDIADTIRTYLAAGSVVWEVDGVFRRITVHRPGQEPETFNALQDLVGDPELPGFRVPVARLFGG